MKWLVAVFACIILAAEARGPPTTGNRGNGPPPEDENRGQGRTSSGLSATKNFCRGLAIGTIVNANATFDAVFASIDPVCDDLLDFFAANEPLRERRTPRGSRPSPSSGSRPSPPSGSRPGPPSGSRPGPPSAASIFRRTCDQVERIPLDDGNKAQELIDILVRFNAVCDVLDSI
ncbi:uncharacterized protein LOC127850345 [Dreissena polymorpha]|uniref:uncharacterized protein LOC127850345 n=1 Tax=Dreissena polymorpha TaxID=45954 RepID=UPI002264F370|nr:uncharacterized protein LOC127850345 [Dreissena polymorpha]